MLALVCCAAAVVGVRSSDTLRGTDFPDFYCAARMLLDGHGSQLYDADLQRQYQAAYAGRVGTLYIHPPFEAVVYILVAWLPLRRAYLLWSFLNLALVAVVTRRLSRDALAPWDWCLLLAASITFVPLLLCLIQGQDSLVLLSLVVLAFMDLRRRRGFAAGCWIGLALFKFQLVLPLVLVLLLTQPKGSKIGLTKGFSLIGLALMGLSAAISGWAVFAAYPKFLADLQAQPFAGIVPQAMANFRGLTYMVFHRDQSLWSVAAVTILSAAALLLTLTRWKRAGLGSPSGSTNTSQAEFDAAFASTVLFSLLVSYHLNPHDLSLLLLPMSVLLHRRFDGTRVFASRGKWMTLGLLAILFLPPLHLWALRAHVYSLTAVPIMFLFLATALNVRRTTGMRSTLQMNED